LRTEHPTESALRVKAEQARAATIEMIQERDREAAGDV